VSAAIYADPSAESLYAIPAPTHFGCYITFEGPEGCGKSTQLPRIAAALTALEYSALTTKEPGGIPATKRYRERLLDASSVLTPKQESLLFWRDRSIHHRTYVRPMVAAGHIVLGDRDFDSSWAYQHHARGVPLDWMLRMQRHAMGEFRPLLTILYDGPVEVLLARAHARRTNGQQHGETRFDDESIAFHSLVRQGFLARAEHEPHRIVVIDALQDPDAITAQTLDAVLKKVF
jgi:dTMP kinase